MKTIFHLPSSIFAFALCSVLPACAAGFPDDSSLSYGLVGHWTMNTTNDWDAVDTSGIGNRGVITNMAGTNLVAGKIGNGLSFDGVNDTVSYFTVNDSSDSTFSYSIWVNATTAMGGTPFSEGTTGFTGCDTTSGIISGYTSANAALEISVGNNGVSVNEHGDTHAPIVASYSATLSGWNHVAIVSISATDMRLYVNGIQRDVALNTAKTRILNAIHLGKKYSCGSKYFTGYLDDVRIYNRALSADEIKQLYGGGYGESTP